MRRTRACRPVPEECGGVGRRAAHRAVSYAEALADGLAGEMARDPRVILVSPGEAGLSPGLAAALGDRFGTGRVRKVAGSVSDLLAEAVAASGQGQRPCVEIPYVAPCCSSWAGALGRGPGRRLPPVLLLHTPADVEPLCVRALLLAFPEVRVVAASDPVSARGLVRAGLRGGDPILCLTHHALLDTRGEIPEGDDVVSPARARLLCQGKDVTLVAHHLSLLHGLAVARELAKEGVSVEVLDPVSLYPLDEETLLASVRRTGRLVIVEEAEGAIGLGAEIAALVCEKAFFDLDAPVKRVGAQWSRRVGPGVGGAEPGPLTIREAIVSIL